ncbi:MAG: LemA family protein [Candidatus Omnitrophica bacterium]|nr:LemA family protein [Candidatus Omnitrophota bacterium]
MATNRIADALKTLFPDDMEMLVPAKKHWWEKVDWSPVVSGWRLWAICLLIAASAYLGIHYYNRMVVLETQVLTDMSQIEAQLQRRKDLIINLTRTVVDYAEHEKSMFMYMADTRAGSISDPEKLINEVKKKGLLDFSAIKEADIKGAMAGVMALAENYPELKLSSNFQNFMDALINIEDRIVERRMLYNTSCNQYGTYLRKFPQMIYAWMFRFKTYDFIKVDKDVALFNRIEY